MNMYLDEVYFSPRRYHRNDCKYSSETCKGLIMWAVENEKMKVEPLQSSKRRSQKGEQRALIWRMHIRTSCYLYVWGEKKCRYSCIAAALLWADKTKEITSLKRAECLSTLNTPKSEFWSPLHRQSWIIYSFVWDYRNKIHFFSLFMHLSVLSFHCCVCRNGPEVNFRRQFYISHGNSKGKNVSREGKYVYRNKEIGTENPRQENTWNYFYSIFIKMDYNSQREFSLKQ